MADVSFPQAIDALYRALDWPPPLRPELAGGTHAFSIEQAGGDVAIRFRLSPNGRSMLIDVADAPRFSEDRAMRQEQVRQVLATALALSSTNRACAGIADETGEGGPPRLAITASVPLATGPGQIGAALKAAVEDVLDLLDWQAAHLTGRGGGRVPATGYSRPDNLYADSEDFVYLRP